MTHEYCVREDLQGYAGLNILPPKPGTVVPVSNCAPRDAAMDWPTNAFIANIGRVVCNNRLLLPPGQPGVTHCNREGDSWELIERTSQTGVELV